MKGTVLPCMKWSVLISCDLINAPMKYFNQIEQGTFSSHSPSYSLFMETGLHLNVTIISSPQGISHVFQYYVNFRAREGGQTRKERRKKVC